MTVVPNFQFYSSSVQMTEHLGDNLSKTSSEPLIISKNCSIGATWSMYVWNLKTILATHFIVNFNFHSFTVNNSLPADHVHHELLFIAVVLCHHRLSSPVLRHFQLIPNEFSLKCVITKRKSIAKIIVHA